VGCEQGDQLFQMARNRLVAKAWFFGGDGHVPTARRCGGFTVFAIRALPEKKACRCSVHGQAFLVGQPVWGTCLPSFLGGCELPRGVAVFAGKVNVTAGNADIFKAFTRGMAKHFGVARDLVGMGPFAGQKDEPAPDGCARNRRYIGGGDEGVIRKLCWHDAGSLVCLLIRGRVSSEPENNLRLTYVNWRANFANSCEIFAKIL
tara:strand:+ start:919 stop:1530 length:612 start_codon:yes stop_codon:yes gene_type:complete